MSDGRPTASPSERSDPDEPGVPADPSVLVASLGRALARLHSGLDDDRPERLPTLDPAAALAAALRAIDEGWQPSPGSPFARSGPEGVRRALVDGAPAATARSGPTVVTVGNARLADVVLPGPGREAGLSGAANLTFGRAPSRVRPPRLRSWSDAALADAYRDLAVAAADVVAVYGPAAVLSLMEAYAEARPEVEPIDPIRLDWWSLVVAVLGPALPAAVEDEPPGPSGRPASAPAPAPAPARPSTDGRVPGRHLVLVGPTASGKSSTAVDVALRRAERGLPTEIVSCDSMAVYRGMDVGTATPSVAARRGVPHHLLDVVDPSEEFSVQRFAAMAGEVLDDIEARGATALLVGGTGLYVQAVTDGLALPGRFPDVLEELEASSTEELRARLEELDPLAASRVPPGNRRRLLRALEVTIGSGSPFSSSGPGLDAYPDTPFVLCALAVPRDDLAPRIEARFRDQLAHGFLDEVRALVDRPDGWSRTAAEALGYRELAAHLRGECTLEEAVALAVRRTRRFAVRQERWFRRDPRLRWFAAAARTGGASGGAIDGPEPVAAIDDLWSERARAGRGSTTTVGTSGSADPTS